MTGCTVHACDVQAQIPERNCPLLEDREYTDSFPPSILADLTQVLKTSFSRKEVSERAERHRLEPLPLHQTVRARLSAILRHIFDSMTCTVGAAEYGPSPGVATALISGQGEECGDNR